MTIEFDPVIDSKIILILNYKLI